MSTTQGFYKNSGGQLLYGPNFVENKDWRLDATVPADHTLTIDGWAWYDSEDEARYALGVSYDKLNVI